MCTGKPRFYSFRHWGLCPQTLRGFVKHACRVAERDTGTNVLRQQHLPLEHRVKQALHRSSRERIQDVVHHPSIFMIRRLDLVCTAYPPHDFFKCGVQSHAFQERPPRLHATILTAIFWTREIDDACPACTLVTASSATPRKQNKQNKTSRNDHIAYTYIRVRLNLPFLHQEHNQQPATDFEEDRCPTQSCPVKRHR